VVDDDFLQDVTAKIIAGTLNNSNSFFINLILAFVFLIKNFRLSDTYSLNFTPKRNEAL